MRILLLGGTTEARRLAGLTADDHEVTTSLAGRTSAPLRPAGDVRIGGFGGADGLARYLVEQRIDVLVDATHPFAAGISGNAGSAAAATGVPLLVVRRPGWTATPGDAWHRVASLEAAVARLTGGRVFLTTGRQTIGAFAARDDCWFLARSVEPPEPPLPRRLEVLLDRGPFTVAGERDLLLRHRIDVLVTKDSGGSDAKLVAARELGVPVLMIDRPPLPAAATVPTAEAAAAWLAQTAAGHSTP
ncbi:cobalt-precorrin-6x reductase [Actinoplanes sp. SE50]|uniref:cobalt-precorrin-6A reductase n=1 Tax=unclassified Actinoplanes TaxID=2626549 RepID=UPI00023ED504|nr:MULTISPECIES: cobalt-precorrin-6A reductase [unclassified Actinoplanes]AEV87875.1 cobalt-precorrin-6x reductase [Actinoplanes sp. SE50/110]ATO86279.1 cobalt-precorrin-6x reductase [Actinoplanes sp. SE50]SLM03694.1 precorrin-6A reductase [Actinoplanes sp. SE50/110]